MVKSKAKVQDNILHQKEKGWYRVLKRQQPKEGEDLNSTPGFLTMMKPRLATDPILMRAFLIRKMNRL
jgi:hypothetical protein